MHQQVEKTRSVEELKVIVAGVEQVLGEGDDIPLRVVVDLELMELPRDDAIQGIVAHFIPFEIDIETTIPVPYPYDLDMLMPVRHLMLVGPLFMQPLQSLDFKLDLLIFTAGG
jgi:hypothetical protein